MQQEGGQGLAQTGGFAVAQQEVSGVQGGASEQEQQYRQDGDYGVRQVRRGGQVAADFGVSVNAEQVVNWDAQC